MTRRFLTTALAALALAAPAVVAPTVVHASGPAHATSGSSRTPVLGPGQVTMGYDVPWDEVGPGWYLTLIDQGPTVEGGIVPKHQLLDLVDPRGGRYQLVKTAVGPDAANSHSLVDWSTDGRMALEVVETRQGRERAVVYDLPHGTHRTVKLGRHLAPVLLAPHGSLYATGPVGDGQTLVRRDRDGAVHPLAEHTDGEPLSSPSMRRVVVGTSAHADHRLLLVNAHGRLIRSLHTPAKCAAVRWWRRGVVMARCFARATIRLYAVPVDGSRGHWLTAYHGKGSPDLGDLDLRRLRGTTYLEASGPCGVVFLARQHADGRATKVSVPMATENVYLLGTRAGRLVLRMGVSCDGNPARDAITHFDPRTGHNRIVAELPLDERYGRILGYAERVSADL
jgi:TolB protein